MKIHGSWVNQLVGYELILWSFAINYHLFFVNVLADQLKTRLFARTDIKDSPWKYFGWWVPHVVINKKHGIRWSHLPFLKVLSRWIPMWRFWLKSGNSTDRLNFHSLRWSLKLRNRYRLVGPVWSLQGWCFCVRHMAWGSVFQPPTSKSWTVLAAWLTAGSLISGELMGTRKISVAIATSKGFAQIFFVESAG